VVGIELDINEFVKLYNKNLTMLLDLVENSLQYCCNLWCHKQCYALSFSNSWCLELEKIKWLIRQNRLRMSHMDEFSSLIPRFYNIIEDVGDKAIQYNLLYEKLTAAIERAIHETQTSNI
jgi:hypothetical protein